MHVCPRMQAVSLVEALAVAEGPLLGSCELRSFLFYSTFGSLFFGGFFVDRNSNYMTRARTTVVPLSYHCRPAVVSRGVPEMDVSHVLVVLCCQCTTLTVL